MARNPTLHKLLDEQSVQALSVRQAAKLLHVAPSTVQRHRQNQPLVPDTNGTVWIPKTLGADGKWRPAKRLPINPARTLAILRLRLQGATIREIATQLGCAPSTVHRELDRRPACQWQTTIDILAKLLDDE